MAPTNKTTDLLRACRRLTGDQGSYRNECTFFRILVTSADGQVTAVTAHVQHHRREPAKANLNDIAEEWRIDRDDLPTVLDDWTEPDLRKWLEQFTAEQLLPPHLRRRRGID